METFLPRFSLDSHKVVFPAVNASESAYRTALLTNNGPTPIVFDFDKDPSEYVMQNTLPRTVVWISVN